MQPAAAGLLIGVIGIWLPQVMGSGYPVIDQVLHDQFVWKMLLLLGVFKIIATGISFVSGTPGGMFAPALFIGATLGGAVGEFEHVIFHRPVSSVPEFALVGMGTFFAAFLRVPITSVFMVVEVSQHYTMIVPTIVANMIAYFISRKYQKVPLFDFLARQDGFFLPSIEEMREQTTLRVEDAMRPPAGLVFHEGNLKEVLEHSQAKDGAQILLWQRDKGWMVAAREELRQFAANGAPAATAATRGPVPQLYPDQHLDEALRVIGDWPMVPVVNRANLDKVEGVISVDDVLHKYRS